MDFLGHFSRKDLIFKSNKGLEFDLSLRKKRSFPLGISSVNVSKSAALLIWSYLLKKPLMENFYKKRSLNKNRKQSRIIVWKSKYNQKRKYLCLTAFVVTIGFTFYEGSSR